MNRREFLAGVAATAVVGPSAVAEGGKYYFEMKLAEPTLMPFEQETLVGELVNYIEKALEGLNKVFTVPPEYLGPPITRDAIMKAFVKGRSPSELIEQHRNLKAVYGDKNGEG